MSDPAKSAHEIEDVLASIRRLVSEGGPVAATISPARSFVAPVAALPDQPDQSAEVGQPTTTRLVLTPALRVMDPDDPWAPVPLKGQDALVAEPSEQTADADNPAWGPDDRLADWGDIDENGPVSEVGAGVLTDALGDQANSQDDGQDDSQDDREILAEFEPETGDADWPDGSAATALRDLAMARGHTPQGDSAADTAAGDAAPPTDTPSEDPMTMAEPAAHPAQDDDTARGRVFSRRAGAQPRDDATPAAQDMDHDDQDDDSDDTDVAQDDLIAAASFDEDVEDLGEATSPFTFPEPDADESVLDEETLRDLIAEVVRQELQGALGQRITRNVRKMVRREVRMALAAEDLE